MCEWMCQSSMKVCGQLSFCLLWAHVRETGCVRMGVCAYIVATPLLGLVLRSQMVWCERSYGMLLTLIA